MARQPEQVRKMRLQMAGLRRRAAERYRIASNLRALASEERRDAKARRAERARAATARRQAEANGDLSPDERARLANLREREADVREAAADERDRRADARQWAADQRDREADVRDRLADERDRRADARDRAVFHSFARMVLLQRNGSGTWTTHYYRMSSIETLDDAMRGLSREDHQAPSRVLGYANRLILRVDHLPGRFPDAAIHDIDPKARRLPEAPAAGEAFREARTGDE